jgi:hypothetical protein
MYLIPDYCPGIATTLILVGYKAIDPRYLS